MKRVSRALVCLVAIVMLCPMALAAEYTGWVVEVSDISVDAYGDVMSTSATLRVTAGMTEDHADGWITLEILDGETPIVTFMADDSRCAFDGADSCAFVRDGFHAFVVDRLNIDNPSQGLSGALDMLDAFLSMPQGVEYLFHELGGAKSRGRNNLAVTVDLPGGSVSGTLSWQSVRRVKKPFDLTSMTSEPTTSANVWNTEVIQMGLEEAELALLDSDAAAEAYIALTIAAE